MGSGVRSDLNTLSPLICNISGIWICDRKARDVITGAWWAGAFGGLWRFWHGQKGGGHIHHRTYLALGI